MKRLFFVFTLCALVPLLLGVSPFIRTDGEPQVQGPVRIYEGLIEYIDGFDTRPASKTIANLDLYVRSAGADTNDCLSAAKACLTIQEAIDRIPTDINHAVTVDVGEGNFAAFNMDGFVIGETGYLYINGVKSIATGLTGLNAGTPEGNVGVDFRCDVTDNEGAWVANELRGKLMVIGGSYYPIITNTATVVSYQGNCAGLGGYEIWDQKTAITGNGELSLAGVEITNVTTMWPDRLIVRNLTKVDASTIGFLMYAVSGTFEYCHAAHAGMWFGFVMGQSSRVARTVKCSAGPVALVGYWFQASGGVSLEDPVAEDCIAMGDGSGIGFMISQSLHVRLDSVIVFNLGIAVLADAVVQLHLKDTTLYGSDYGIDIDPNDNLLGSNVSSGSNVWLEDVYIHTNTVVGIVANSESNVVLDQVRGTNSGNLGLMLRTGATLKRTSGVLTLTGGSNDFSINDGTTELDWATYLNAAGDTVTNTDNGCRAEYYDAFPAGP